MRTIEMVLALLAAGDSPSVGLEETLNRGLKEYARGEWRSVVKTLRAVAPRLVDPPKRAVAYLHLGLAQIELKQFRFAEDSFVLALTADPSIDVDSVEHPPRAVAIFRTTRERLDATLNVAVDGPPARIIVDGVGRGQSPLSLKLRIGRHRVRAETEDRKHYAEETPVILRVGQAISVTLNLRPRPVAKPPERAVPTQPRLLIFETVIQPQPLSPELPPQDVTAVRAPPQRLRKTRTWGWIAAGTGAATLAIGAVVYFGVTAPRPDSRNAYNLAVTRYNTRLTVGGGLLIGGAAIGLGAVALFALHRDPSRSSIVFSLPLSDRGPLAGVAVAIRR